MNKFLIIFLWIVFILAFSACGEFLRSAPVTVRAQVENLESSKTALENNEPGAKERAIESIRNCKTSLLEYDEAVKSRDKKIGELETEIAKLKRENSELSQDAGFKSGFYALLYTIAGLVVISAIVYFVLKRKTSLAGLP